MDESSMARLPLCNHLLQHTLRDVCSTESEWVYSVFWRILPRNFPPPKWELGGYLDRSKANKRNWILVWEDGFCDFARTAVEDVDAVSSGAADELDDAPSIKRAVENSNIGRRLHPELFFKMSHEIYNYGEGLMGKIAADNGHKWIYRDPPERDNRLVSFWHNTIDPQPRIWEAQFKSGIQTIVVVAVREGLLQLGSTRQVLEDVNFVMLLQRKFNSLQQLAAPQPAAAIDSSSSLASAAAVLQRLLCAPEQVMNMRSCSWQEPRRGVKRQLGKADVDQEILEPASTSARKQQLERGLSWGSSGDNNYVQAQQAMMMHRGGQQLQLSVRQQAPRQQVQHQLDLLMQNATSAATCPPTPDVNLYSLQRQNLHEQQQLNTNTLPLAHEVQAAADHLSLNHGCVSTSCSGGGRGTDNLGPPFDELYAAESTLAAGRFSPSQQAS